MERLNKLKQSKAISALAVILGAVMFFGTLAGAINDLIDFFNQGWLEGVGGWYAAATGWLSAEISAPLWVSLLVTTLVLLLGFRCLRLSTQLKTLKNPTLPALDSLQERVLFWVIRIYDSVSTGVGPTPAYVAQKSNIPLSEVEAALDALKEKQLVKKKKMKSDPIDLTPQGRAYVSQPGIKARFVLSGSLPEPRL